MQIQLVAVAHRTTNQCIKKAFSLTWLAAMQVYWNKRMILHKARFKLLQDWFVTPHGRHLIVLLHQQGLNDPTTRWQRKRRVKSEFTFFQCLSRLFLPIYLSKVDESPGVEFLGSLSKFTKRN